MNTSVPRSIFSENTGLAMDFRQLKPERFINEISRGARERHTQKKFVPRAMNISLKPASRWKESRPQPRSTAASRTEGYYWSSTQQINRSNVKRKPAARGHT